MRISDWSSDVCSSDLHRLAVVRRDHMLGRIERRRSHPDIAAADRIAQFRHRVVLADRRHQQHAEQPLAFEEMVEIVEHRRRCRRRYPPRSEEHTSELQSLMRISYAVFCLKKKKRKYKKKQQQQKSNKCNSRNNKQTRDKVKQGKT